MRSRSVCLVLAAALCGGPALARAQGPAAPAPPPAPRVIPGEQIKITVTGEPEFSDEYTVDGRGEVLLPMVGAVRVGGLTYEQAAAAVERALREVIRAPAVSVQPAQPLRVAVVGGVVRPGYVDYREGITALQAVVAAEGPVSTARMNRAYVVRRGLENPEKPERIEINLARVGQSGRPDVALATGDVVFVPVRSTRDRENPLLRLLGLGSMVLGLFR